MNFFMMGVFMGYGGFGVNGINGFNGGNGALPDFPKGESEK